MKTQRIVSKNATWQKFEVLKSNRNKRYRYRQFFVEGVRNLNEAIHNGWTIDSFIFSFEFHLSDWARNLLETVPTQVNYALSGSLMSQLSSKTDASELCALIRMRDDQWTAANKQSDHEGLLAVLFDRPSNKGNLGTMIRSCDALGVDRLLLTGHGVDRYDPEVVAASMGSLFRLPIIYLADNGSLQSWIDEHRQMYPSLQIVGTTAHQEQPINQVDLTDPTLLIIGNEADGMSRWLREQCTTLATIPMNPSGAATSLNVSCAATVLLYEVWRQRSSKHG
ncbi:MAG: TrmH family RNA methyltransferase [Bacillota bacterium]|nr:TrmH family RNA methyltransferase [Bacillota bacterium]